MYYKWKIISVGITIVLLGFLFQIILQSVMRPYAKDNIYFQEWSSESMMQTVSIKDLHDAPMLTLLNIHIQPPGFDIIRAILVYIWPSPDSLTSLKHVDLLLYLMWALLYGFLGLLVFIWMYKFSGMGVAIIAALVFLLHPASIFYATYLDITLLSSLLILLMYYLLWKIKNGYNVSIIMVAILTLALFFTRSIFQLPFIIVIATSLFLFEVPKRKILLFLLITGGVVVFYMGKQYYQFGILSTSSFTGLNLTTSVGIENLPNYLNYLDDDDNLSGLESTLPNVLKRKKKNDGTTNFNHIGYLKLNQHLIDKYNNYITSTPLSQLFIAYLHNLWKYFKPSSRYTKHLIVDRLPWRSFYDRIFSFPVFNVLLLLSGILWLMKVDIKKDYMKCIGIILPGLYIFLISVIFERRDNMRYKFFLEPVLFVFLVSQIHAISQRVYQRLLMKNNF